MGETHRVVTGFDEWRDLAERDPVAFELKRRAAIERLIASAPAERRQRLRCLHWRIDAERRRSSTPMGACIGIYTMMWERISGPGGLLECLDGARGIALGNTSRRRLSRGNVVALPLPPK